MKHTEHQTQTSCVKYFRLRYPKCLIYATANERATSPQSGARMKKQGVLAGVADLTIITPFQVFFIEMKAPKGTQSVNQKIFESKVNELGYSYYLCYSFDEFVKVCDRVIEAKRN